MSSPFSKTFPSTSAGRELRRTGASFGRWNPGLRPSGPPRCQLRDRVTSARMISFAAGLGRRIISESTLTTASMPPAAPSSTNSGAAASSDQRHCRARACASSGRSRSNFADAVDPCRDRLRASNSSRPSRPSHSGCRRRSSIRGCLPMAVDLRPDHRPRPRPLAVC